VSNGNKGQHMIEANRNRPMNDHAMRLRLVVG